MQIFANTKSDAYLEMANIKTKTVGVHNIIYLNHVSFSLRDRAVLSAEPLFSFCFDWQHFRWLHLVCFISVTFILNDTFVPIRK